jgi:hypothetical protein
VSRPGHDAQCEWGQRCPIDMGGLPPEYAVREDCKCAVRAYQRDPLPGVEEPPDAQEDPW